MSQRPPFSSLLLLTLLLPACSGNDEPTAGFPSQTVLSDAGEPSEIAPPPPPAPPEDTLVVIEPGVEEDPTRGLIEASRRERERRAETGKPEVVLTNENLAEYQEGAQLTFAHEDTEAPAGEEGAPDPNTDPQIGESYWRNRGLQIRTGWRESLDRIEELQGEISELRRRFYEEDDPQIRDTLVKPAWDRALEELVQARDDARQLEEDLGEFLDLGYETGAFPEWLDEGSELEPDDEEIEQLRRGSNTIHFDEPETVLEDFEPEDGR